MIPFAFAAVEQPGAIWVVCHRPSHSLGGGRFGHAKDGCERDMIVKIGIKLAQLNTRFDATDWFSLQIYASKTITSSRVERLKLGIFTGQSVVYALAYYQQNDRQPYAALPRCHLVS